MTSTEMPSSAQSERGNATPAPVHPSSRVTLPTRTLMLAVIVPCLLVAGFWSTAIALGPWGTAEFMPGMIGIGLVLAVSMAGTLIMSPWKARLIEDWMTMWLASTVFRLLVTPIVAYLIYSAASSALAVKPLGLSIALTYMACLFVEAAALARHLKSIGDRHAIRQSHTSP